MLHWDNQTLCARLRGATPLYAPWGFRQAGSQQGLSAAACLQESHPTPDTQQVRGARVHTGCCSKGVLPKGRKAAPRNYDWIYKHLNFSPLSFFISLSLNFCTSHQFCLLSAQFSLNLCSFRFSCVSLTFCSLSKVLNCFTLTYSGAFHFRNEDFWLGIEI